MIDLKSIFDIFPYKYINQDFNFFINGKVDSLKTTLFDLRKENENKLIDVIDEWILINYENKLDLTYCFHILETDYDLISKYYFHYIYQKK